MSELNWEDQTKVALIGDIEIDVLATTEEPDDSAVVLFRYKDKPAVYALRWSIGQILELGTDDVALAKGSINTMVMMEAGDED